MNIRISIITALATCAPLLSSYSAETLPSSRSIRLAERFHFYCLESAPDFHRIETRSTAMGLKVIDDQVMAMPDGSQVHKKNWVVTDAGGEFELMSLDSSGDAEPVTECGVAATDVNGSDLAAALAMDASLGAPIKHVTAESENASTVWWNVKWGAKTAKVMLSYQNAGMPGAVINVIYRKTAVSPGMNR
jgi:hypothetical protein